jgi:hypothetical protein
MASIPPAVTEIGIRKAVAMLAVSLAGIDTAATAAAHQILPLSYRL